MDLATVFTQKLASLSFVWETKRVRNVPLKKLHCFNAVGQKARSVCSELSPSDRPSACVCASFVFPLLQAKTKWTPASHLNWAGRRDGRRARGRACGRTRWDSGGVVGNDRGGARILRNSAHVVFSPHHRQRRVTPRRPPRPRRRTLPRPVARRRRRTAAARPSNYTVAARLTKCLHCLNYHAAFASPFPALLSRYQQSISGGRERLGPPPPTPGVEPSRTPRAPRELQEGGRKADRRRRSY